ncbi:hypothetical protein A3I90_00350 [Candidatus Nomurabacteria bacterium RIFCSPLOWO2_02_FULL_41_9]|nr:MAG: hypothetical protein A3I90_00350 [Candidatus Nomurabacteria bacterium RIFCSPLOWO2_02_FULL_41_9]
MWCAEIQIRTRFCETILREGGFAKPRLMFLKFGGDSGFRPAGECGRNAGRAFWILAEGASRNSNTKMVKSFYERF